MLLSVQERSYLEASWLLSWRIGFGLLPICFWLESELFQFLLFLKLFFLLCFLTFFFYSLGIIHLFLSEFFLWSVSICFALIIFGLNSWHVTIRSHSVIINTLGNLRLEITHLRSLLVVEFFCVILGQCLIFFYCWLTVVRSEIVNLWRIHFSSAYF